MYKEVSLVRNIPNHLDFYEKIKMYKMCGLKDTTESLSVLDLEKGIQNYKPENLKTLSRNNSY